MDGEPVVALALATLSGMEGFFCAAAVCRPPEASTGPLERLWCRFADFGIDATCPRWSSAPSWARWQRRGS